MKPLPPPEISDEEMAWRTGWAFAYSGAANLYGDDGELQDNRWPMIDWMRDSSLEIRDKIYKRGMMNPAVGIRQKRSQNNLNILTTRIFKDVTCTKAFFE